MTQMKPKQKDLLDIFDDAFLQTINVCLTEQTMSQPSDSLLTYDIVSIPPNQSYPQLSNGHQVEPNLFSGNKSITSAPHANARGINNGVPIFTTC